MTSQTELQPQMKPQRLIIYGLTKRGQKFRPSNWPERLCSSMSTLGARSRQLFSPYVYVSFLPEVKSLIVERELWETNPKGYESLVSFAKDNNLRTREENG